MRLAAPIREVHRGEDLNPGTAEHGGARHDRVRFGLKTTESVTRVRNRAVGWNLGVAGCGADGSG